MNTTDEHGDPREPSPSEVTDMQRSAPGIVLTYLEKSSEHPDDPVGWFVVTELFPDPITRDFFGLDYESALDLFMAVAEGRA